VLPGFFLLSTRATIPGTVEMNEISLVLKTLEGGVLIVGCAHLGIEKIIEAAVKIEPQLSAVFGGFVDVPESRVTEMVMSFRE
jgi:7,8-dihydropterin-6-yl-methyl-4-(beta-D-ribofuranosyl)aminobenzene 5'-phosphate synthase